MRGRREGGGRREEREEKRTLESKATRSNKLMM
jgi:hypothetical protein